MDSVIYYMLVLSITKLKNKLEYVDIHSDYLLFTFNRKLVIYRFKSAHIIPISGY